MTNDEGPGWFVIGVSSLIRVSGFDIRISLHHRVSGVAIRVSVSSPHPWP
jgi:hypothetical protein